MSERKRGYRKGDFEVKKEAEMLEGLSWLSWRPTLINRMVNEGLEYPNSNGDEILHQWFVLRHLRKLGKIDNDEFKVKQDKLFEGKDEIFENESIKFALKFITEKTEKVRT